MVDPGLKLEASVWGKDQHLIDWFKTNVNSLPLTPYELDETDFQFKGYEPQHLKIKNPKNFYDCLKADIGKGPNGWNSVTRVLQNRLAMLKAKFG